MVTNEQIIKLRDSLLALHSSLLEYQKHEYEQDNQKIASPAQYFHLVTTHPSFSWLRQISELIVSMDEMLESKEAVSEEKIASVVEYVRSLFAAEQGANDFSIKYQQAIQKNPSVALKHGEVMSSLG